LKVLSFGIIIDSKLGAYKHTTDWFVIYL